jgi:CspA family cold shock protein
LLKSAINGTGYKTLIAGQTVSFDLQRGDRGLHAINVTVLSVEEDATA